MLTTVLEKPEQKIFLPKYWLRRVNLHLGKTILNLMEQINNRFPVHLLAQNSFQLIDFYGCRGNEIFEHPKRNTLATLQL